MELAPIATHPFANHIPEGHLINVEKVEFSNSYEKVRPHRHEYFELFVFEDMHGSHFVDFENFPIVPRSIHLISPKQVHRIVRTAGSGCVIMFKKELLEDFNMQHKLIPGFAFLNNNQHLCIPVK